MIEISTGLMILIRYLFFLAHISGSNSFPQPLSPEEEAYHLKRLAEGHEDSKNILIEHNLRLVAHIVKKYNNTGKDIDDLISIGTIGLIKAILTYKSDKRTRLATYAARCIDNEILMTIRAGKKNKGEVSLQDPIGIDKEGNEITLLDVLGTEPEIVQEIVEGRFEEDRLRERVKRLSPRERNVLVLRFGLFNSFRKTQREIARMLGISRSYVSRIEKRAIQKLMRELSMDSPSNKY